ncbi:MAG: ATP-binding cassette domain-containing protein [Sphaerochaetaceae bacterium]|nr:ATP-binding cassette domain-containing protein [Sphaerochaetaceae bacterium]
MSLCVDIRKDFGNFSLAVNFETQDLITGLLGASGAGKSLTLKCIAGIERPDSGRIVLNGRVLFDSQKGIDLRVQDRKVGYLFQNYALFPTMSVKKNILVGLHNEKDKSVKETLYNQVVAMLHLEEIQDQRPATLSGGQAQRVALARILVNRPDVILLDEPFSALDSDLKAELEPQLLDLLKDYGKPVVMVTHNRDEASFLCSHVATIQDGRITAFGKTDDLIDIGLRGNLTREDLKVLLSAFYKQML